MKKKTPFAVLLTIAATATAEERSAGDAAAKAAADWQQQISASAKPAAAESSLGDAAAKATAEWQKQVGAGAQAAAAEAAPTDPAGKAILAWQQQIGAPAAPAAAAPAAAADKPVTEPAKTAQAEAPADNKTADAKAPAPKLWSWLPLVRPEVPSVQQKEWVRTPVDAFVLQKLEEKGLKPSGDADKASLIRRVTLDLWGLIPTPEEVQTFVSDTSPDAYEKLVDRLLASPRYGERQARHWLDLSRYADSAGFQGDQTRPNNWRYRDYVIKAFNEDKGYNRFLQEQIAGDEIDPNNQELLVATGFMAGYPDNSNSRDMVQRKYQITTDIT
ncbi:MAG: DUF1549 domain-containing protein, partial [Methylococcaceae bacterium]|nr:DUF1549 domain-containing protein [Methylococcaceae bacterium]